MQTCRINLRNNPQNIKIQPVQYVLPVEQPRLFGAGQSVHEFLRFGSNGSVFVQGPCKVPLILSSLSDCIAVHNGLQVGINPGSNENNMTKDYSSPHNPKRKCHDRQKRVKVERSDRKSFEFGLSLALRTHLLCSGLSINSLNQPVTSSKQSSNPLPQAREMALTWLYLHRDATTKCKH